MQRSAPRQGFATQRELVPTQLLGGIWTGRLQMLAQRFGVHVEVAYRAERACEPA